MTAIPNAVFNNSDVRLRVWFNLKAAMEFEQKNTKDTKSVTCEDPAQI